MSMPIFIFGVFLYLLLIEILQGKIAKIQIKNL